MAKRRGNNEGSIHELPSGSWRAQITLDGFRLSYTSKLRRDCQAWLKKTIGQIDEGMNYDSTRVTLEDFLSSWINSSKTRVRPRTYTQYTQLSRQYIFPHLGMIKIRDLRPEQIQKMYDKLLSQEVGVYTILKIHSILSAALEYALRLSVVSRNPATLAMPPQKPAMEMKILDEGQVSQLLITARGNRLEGLLQLTLSTGIREMELLGLKWTDLDWVKRTLKIERQLAREKNLKSQFVSPKTRAGKRTIVLGKSTIELLRAHYERQLEERKAAGEKWHEQGLIFTNRYGGPMDSRNLLRDFKNLLSQSGLPEMRFHDLRHTAASLMLNRNVNPLAVSKRLGHARTSITLDTYGHLMPNLQEEVAEVIDELITPIPLGKKFSEPAKSEVAPKEG